MRAHRATFASSNNCCDRDSIRCDADSRHRLMSASVLACAHASFGVVGVFMDSMFVQHVTKRHEEIDRFISARSLTRTANLGDS